jgi:hypothetical protein
MSENTGENRAVPTRATRLAKPSARSRVSNGKDLFVGGVDGRTAYARRYRDILAQLTSDAGGDPSEAQAIIIRRATQLAVWCEMAEADAASGLSLNVAEYCTATNTLRRLLLDLGLERRLRDITRPSTRTWPGLRPPKGRSPGKVVDRGFPTKRSDRRKRSPRNPSTASGHSTASGQAGLVVYVARAPPAFW